MRVLLDREPFSDASNARQEWPAKWVKEPGQFDNTPRVTAYRCKFDLPAAQTIRVHVTADERYELFVDGKRIGRGSERGDQQNWFYESYDLRLAAGRHTVVARTWWLGRPGPSPFAQMTVKPGFLLAAEGVAPELLSTGFATWECKRLGGYRQLPHGDAWGCGAKQRIIGEEFDWGFEAGTGDGWVAVQEDGAAWRDPSWSQTHRALRPAVLPAMHEVATGAGSVRYVGRFDPSSEVRRVSIQTTETNQEQASQWQALLRDGKPLEVPAHSNVRVIIDLENYYCAYPHLVTTSGRGAKVRIHWAETLFCNNPPEKGWIQSQPKRNRNDVDGRVFWGVGDEFELDGGANRTYETLWWEAGRYIEVLVSTTADPVTINSLKWLDVHYPHHFESKFEASDSRLAEIIPMALRTIEMCSHETYMDCPYFEQLQYVGDTRLQVLVTYATTRDDRLSRKAVEMFDASRDHRGLTHSRYPNREPQFIPPFSLWWVAMVWDYAVWRDDAKFVRARLPGVRNVLDHFLQRINADGLLEAPIGWNYVDWVPTWKSGMPPGAASGISSILNLKLAWVLRQAAELEEHFGEPELAARDRRHADAVNRGVFERFWSEQRGMVADDLDQKHFSEHAQCLAILGGPVQAQRRERMITGLLTATDLARTTIYFSHYLFETLYTIGRTDVLLDRMPLWFDLKQNGLCTTVESPEPTRSDCHAWGAHPVYHYFASLLGIRPAGIGFKEVRIQPRLASLTSASGSMTHPRGMISVDLKNDQRQLSGKIVLPDGLSGTFVAGGKTLALKPGRNNIENVSIV